MPSGGVHRRTPSALKVLRGTDRADRRPENEPKPKPVAPAPPSYLDAAARSVWKRYAPMLERLGLLTEAEPDTLAAFCGAVTRYVASLRRYRKVAKAVRGVDMASLDIIRRAEISVEQSERCMRLLANEFGLTPAARCRLSIPEAKRDDETVLDRLWGQQG